MPVMLTAATAWWSIRMIVDAATGASPLPLYCPKDRIDYGAFTIRPASLPEERVGYRYARVRGRQPGDRGTIPHLGCAQSPFASAGSYARRAHHGIAQIRRSHGNRAADSLFGLPSSDRSPAGTAPRGERSGIAGPAPVSGPHLWLRLSQPEPRKGKAAGVCCLCARRPEG